MVNLNCSPELIVTVTGGTPRPNPLLGVGHFALETQIRNAEGYSNIYERDTTVGGLVIIGHWTIGWCLYQYGTSVTQNILAGTLRSGITVNFQNNKLTIQSSISDSTAIYVPI